MKKYWQYNKRAYGLFFRHMNKFVGYRIVSSMIITLMLIPGLTQASKGLMAVGGYDYLTNNLIKKFLLSPAGVLLIILGLIVAFLVVLMELGGIVVLAHQMIRGEKESRFIDILRYSLKQFKKLVSTDGILIALYLIILAPLFSEGLSSSLLSNIKIPGFIMQSIHANDALSLAFAGLVVLILVLSFRWMFALFVLMLEDDGDKKILKRSHLIRKKKLKALIQYGLVSLVYNLGVLLVVLLAYGLVGLGILVIFSAYLEVAAVLLVGLVLVIVFILLAIEVPVNLIALTFLYHDLSGRNEALDIRVIEGSTWLNRLLKNRVFVVMSLTLALAITSIGAYAVYKGVEGVKYQVFITAHRGSSFEAPENTLSAIEIAYKNGADYVEIDVQLTQDGHLVLLHDETFKRTSGVDLRPDQMTLEEIQVLDAGQWFSEAFQGETYVSLDQVMVYAKDKIKLNIEIKGSKHSPQVRQAVVDLILKHDYLDDCVVTSLNYEDIKGVEYIDSRVKTGYIMFIAFGNLEKLYTDFYSIEASNVNASFVSAAHEIGREVHVWTVNTEEEMKKMLDLGVDNIITDKDKKLKEIIDQSKK